MALIDFVSLTFDVIQSIDSQQDLSSFELSLVLCEHSLDAGLLERVDELERIDADGEGAQLRCHSLVRQPVVAVRGAEDALAAFLEVARVVIRVEADQIGLRSAAHITRTAGRAKQNSECVRGVRGSGHPLSFFSSPSSVRSSVCCSCYREHSFEQLFASGEHAVDLVRRKGSVLDAKHKQ